MHNIATVNTTTQMHPIDIMEKALKFSEVMAQSDIIPSHYKGKPANVFIAVQSALRMNLDPMQVMQNTFVISGKLGMVSSFAISLANGSGLFASGIRYRVEGDGDKLKVTAYANLKKTGEEISYTIGMKEAIAENWTKNPKYRTLPELMLRYRAATLLIRTHAPEVLNGMHMVEEIEDVAISTKDVTPKTQSISSKLDSVLLSQEDDVQEQNDTKVSTTLTRLMGLIIHHNVPDEIIDKWCSKAAVESIALLDEEKQQACIKHINEQYNYSQDIEAA
jgi:hypothetical protein